ncbi:MCE family protein [Mycobacterium conspicuum]|uniref:Mammalian cell entry protein n=1 Tax=Mycobacterium conspicuum TaxID=44010 RepID=A0A1X1T0G1_9MYCO|nr:MCE family protein [Mycobacterium conspicuum]ORV37731.1 mammalian cell entry protein [Mycobacterium conspicuum]BBZ41499.1 mammalian cell entry protein [Mycobacterium conspicuum]
MTAGVLGRRISAICSCVMLAATGCAFNGVNSLALPGAVGRGPGAHKYHVEIANVGTLESNSPVMINDVVVGSVGKMTLEGWHVDVEISVKPDVVVPANAVASVGQTSLLGSMHLELNPPLGQSGSGSLHPGATIPLNNSSTFPSTEQTLSSLSIFINTGGFTQIGDIIHNFNAALSGRAGDVRDLLNRFDKFVGVLDDQRDNLVASLQEFNRLAGTFAEQRDVITQALHTIPRALDVLIRERPRIVSALDKLRVFSDTTTRLVDDAGTELVTNLKNVEPAIRALADIGPELDKALAYFPTFPFPQNLIDRGVRGDYVNEFVTLDLTNAGLRKALLLGTHWGRLGAELPPAPGDPAYLQYQYTPDPLNPSAPGPVAPPAGAPLVPTAAPGPAFPVQLPLPSPGAPPPAPPAPPGAPAGAGLGSAPPTDGSGG